MPASFSMIRLPRRISRQVDDFVVDREVPTSGRVELEGSQRPDPRAAWCPPGSTRSGSLPLFRDPQLSIQLVPASSIGCQRDGPLAVPNRCLAAKMGANRRGGQRSVRPREVHLEAAPGAQSLHRSRGLSLGQGGKQVDLAVGGVTLKQHLGNAGREGEVAVHLKRRVAAEEVGIDAAGLEAEGLPAAAASDPAAMGAGSLPWRPGDLLQPLKLAAAESRSVTEPACSILSASSFTMMVPSSAFARRWHSKLIPSPSSVGA